MEKKTEPDSRFNTIKEGYIEALNAGSNPEELHSRLHSLLLEAIKIDITLKELLDILSYTCTKGSEQRFQNNVSDRYQESEEYKEDSLKKIN